MNCLAATGSDSWIPITAGAVLLALGIAFWLVSRRLKRRGAAALGLTLLLLLGAGALGTASSPSAQADTPCPAAHTPAPTVPPTAVPTTPPPVVPVPDFTPSVELSADTTTVNGTITASIDLEELLDVAATGPITVAVDYPAFATATFSGTGWTVISDDGAGSAQLEYLPIVGAGAATAPLALSLVQNGAPVTSTGIVTVTIQNDSGGDSDPGNNVATAEYTIVAPDLTDAWTIPNTVFTSYAETKTVVLTLTEVNGVETDDGTIRFRITKPSGFAFLPYDATATTATPSGGSAMTVANGGFVFSEAGAFITLTAVPGFGVDADASVSVALQLGVAAGTASGTQQNITATIIGDPSFGYDSNNANNATVFAPSLQLIDLTPTITAVPDVVPVTGTAGVFALTIQNLNTVVPSLAGAQIRILESSNIWTTPTITDPDWSLERQGLFYVFTFTQPIQPGQTVSLPVDVVYSFGAASSGSAPVTASLVTGSGGDTNILNNGSSDRITFGATG